MVSASFSRFMVGKGLSNSLACTLSINCTPLKLFFGPQLIHAFHPDTEARRSSARRSSASPTPTATVVPTSTSVPHPPQRTNTASGGGDTLAIAVTATVGALIGTVTLLTIVALIVLIAVRIKLRSLARSKDAYKVSFKMGAIGPTGANPNYTGGTFVHVCVHATVNIHISHLPRKCKWALVIRSCPKIWREKGEGGEAI